MLQSGGVSALLAGDAVLLLVAGDAAVGRDDVALEPFSSGVVALAALLPDALPLRGIRR